MMDHPDTLTQAIVDSALSLFSGDLTDDTLAAHLKTLRADAAWRVFVLEGPKTRDVELIYTPTNAWYVLRLTKVWRLRGQVWRRVF
jgi:hypothetical protein